MTRRGSSPDIDSGSGGGSGGNFYIFVKYPSIKSSLGPGLDLGSS